jgi:hypothetical protein
MLPGRLIRRGWGWLGHDRGGRLGIRGNWSWIYSGGRGCGVNNWISRSWISRSWIRGIVRCFVDRRGFGGGCANCFGYFDVRVCFGG